MFSNIYNNVNNVFATIFSRTKNNQRKAKKMLWAKNVSFNQTKKKKSAAKQKSEISCSTAELF